MKHKMVLKRGTDIKRSKVISKFQIAICCMVILHGNVSTAKPLDPEDLESLLPPTPHDKNETMAAVVQDPVVQDAVQQAASNASLNGLVVKKNVYILPATDPNRVLSKREHILVVPTENLEDVRRNITEAKRAEAESGEFTSPENQPFIGDEDEYTSESLDIEGSGNEAVQPTKDVPFQWTEYTEQSPSNAERKTETKFLEDKLTHDAPMPEDDSKKVAVPIVAVIDPSNAEKGKVNSPIVAILPNQLNKDALENQVQFLKDNSDKIQSNAQNVVDESSLTIDPDYRKPSTTPLEMKIASSPTEGTLPVQLLPEVASSMATEDFLAPVVVQRWRIVEPIFTDDAAAYPRQTGDMEVAEDIIFRPLFRYRQEAQEQSRYSSYDYYPRRRYGYGSRYND
ncbi:uncharacterized protein LOC128894604 isoform X1 [Hylaeus anthracinus]|uniref:uncharacterized protein LOC128894604 isoform X1 n=1 Tax=Hylaeus anthracinus TaxID=313031 RepID=UPI0023B9918D|nr:uncharacterized protein LOC128894604 isoform X1 [Hylaeus anthracinus]